MERCGLSGVDVEERGDATGGWGAEELRFRPSASLFSDVCEKIDIVPP
jgi:hypothetical protein